MRLAIYGGSFDPPHLGHFLSAQDAIEQLQLDRLVLVPAATQPLKAGRAAASAEHRLAMVRLMVEGDRRFDVSATEVQRAGLSYSVDTLSQFAAEHPADERYFLVGADVLSTFSQWREPERVLELARVVVLERGGAIGSASDAVILGHRVRRLATRRIDVSSTEIRERVRQGWPIRGFVADNVAAYIARHGLYR